MNASSAAPVQAPPKPLRPAALAAVALGGAVGALGRYAVGRGVPVEPGSFPWSTFVINVVGTTLLALLLTRAAVRRHPLALPALGTGVLGGFTTLSLYAEETRALLAGGHVALAAAYAVGTLLACLAAVAFVGGPTSSADRTCPADGPR